MTQMRNTAVRAQIFTIKRRISIQYGKATSKGAIWSAPHWWQINVLSSSISDAISKSGAADVKLMESAQFSGLTSTTSETSTGVTSPLSMTFSNFSCHIVISTYQHNPLINSTDMTYQHIVISTYRHIVISTYRHIDLST